MIEITHLKYISVLAQELNFQRAAQKLGVTQPNLSQQLKKIEIELGLKLFERNNKFVKLTREAESFVIKIREVLKTMDQITNEMKEQKTGLSGTIILSAIPTIGPYLIPKILPRLKKLAPNIKLIIREETTSQLIESLKSGVCDLGLMALPVNDKQLVTRKMAREDFFLAVAHNHALAQKKSVSFTDITSEEVLILGEGHCFRDQALEYCHRHHFQPNIIFEGSSLSSVVNLAASGQGVTFVPQMSLQYFVMNHLKFIPFEKHTATRDIGVAWRFTMPLSHVQKFFLKLIEEVSAS